ncbi:FAD dependent oxidoreductase [uncultured Alphaproteobacteria bacterium]|uniref:FAD dependent oxidoreductase n=1 Tax=uncultured Alphaproteobacteria bacterium TaxID=91750 RepID=A0A212KLG3_9PROT|nr:FAD dependent oxidoreductase [uncultured Alphaproteobacteria bacterium]
MDSLDAVVIGAGVVGLATARALARAGREVTIVERAASFGTGTSSRNSEVLHAGLYYPPDSLRARVCSPGRNALYAYCAERGIPHKRIGKLLVACSEDEAARLPTIQAQAEANGAEGLRLLSAAEARALEPELTCAAALLSPATGIVDSHALMLALLADAEAAGATLAVETPVESLAAHPGGGAVLACAGGFAVHARLLVNAAGLDACRLAAGCWSAAAPACPRAYMAKGNYFALSVRAPFARLVYPLPQPGGLGVHLTLDLGGHARFGPDVEWIDRESYAVDPARAERFYPAIRRYWPGLPDGALAPDTAGIRPKIVPEGAPAQDFFVAGAETHGVPGVVHLLGIESPGLTSCLALADLVAARVAVGAAV